MDSKPFVVNAYEPRMDFYDDDLSPIIGYLLVTLTVIAFIFGSLCFLGEYVSLETGVANIDFFA